jgi:hypothetical protein
MNSTSVCKGHPIGKNLIFRVEIPYRLQDFSCQRGMKTLKLEHRNGIPRLVIGKKMVPGAGIEPAQH